MTLRRRLSLALPLVLAPLVAAPVVGAKVSHEGWPVRDVLIMHKQDEDGPIWGKPNLHNELLGGNGNDVIHGRNESDVIWGDFRPSGQPTTQVDVLYGGGGKDFIYASHGRNIIWTGGGADIVHAHFGRGEIHCQSRDVLVILSHHSQPGYKLYGCPHISFQLDPGGG